MSEKYGAFGPRPTNCEPQVRFALLVLGAIYKYLYSRAGGLVSGGDGEVFTNPLLRSFRFIINVTPYRYSRTQRSRYSSPLK
jgi:hypothetical protein